MPVVAGVRLRISFCGGNMRKELCRATYFAQELKGQLILYANGVHPTSGYRTYFEPYRVPNVFALIHERSEGNVLETVMPFCCHVAWFTPAAVTSVLVIDADGKHNVPVERVPEKQLVLAHRGGDVPGPFVLPDPGIEPSSPDTDARDSVLKRSEGVGYSGSFSFEEALENAIIDANNKMPASTLADSDQFLQAEVVSIQARKGGIAGLHHLCVHVIASGN